MESYFLRVKTFSRGKGSSATKAAAYRAGERIRDERSGAVFDYSDRTDVAHSEIIIPIFHSDDNKMAWALKRSVLWNAVQNSGRNWNARLAREVLVLLPTQLTSAQRTDLIRVFGHELADRYGSAVDVAIHRPRPWADQRHHHAHLLMTTRQIGPDGLGPRTVLDLSGTERHARGLGPSRDELLWLRARWEKIANEALERAGMADRIDHRSYKAQGIDREPKPLIPQNIFYAERGSGKTTPAGDDIRARHRERLEARSNGQEPLERVLERQRRVGHQHAVEQARDRKEDRHGIPPGALTKEQLKEKRREYFKANAAEINRKQRERRRANAEEVNRKQRERRVANLDETRRKDRDRYYASRRGPEVKPRNAFATQNQAPKARSAGNDSNQTRGRPAGESRTASPEKSVEKWLVFRAAQAPAPQEESLNRWLAYRQQNVPSVGDTSRDRSQNPNAGKEKTQDQASDGSKAKSDRKSDMSL